MKFNEFAQLLRPIIGGSSNTGAFVKTLFDAMITDDGRDALDEIADSSYRAYYNGNSGISKIAQKISPYIETENFVTYIDPFSDETTESICDSFRPYLPEINSFNAGKLLANLFRDIIKEAASEKRKSTQQGAETKTEKTPHDILNDKILASGQALADAWGNAIVHLTDDSSKPLTPITPTRYDSNHHIIYLGATGIKLPVQLVPEDAIAPQELPYVYALCEVYAEKITQAVTPDTVDSLSPALRRHFAEQRKSYYSAESVQRSVREVFADGEQQFDILKDDAYEGIEPTYYDDSHITGYDRLKAVLDKITSTTLSKSSLMNVVGLIGNLEKKGICHLLVNDERIRSWVNLYDETV